MAGHSRTGRKHRRVVAEHEWYEGDFVVVAAEHDPVTMEPKPNVEAVARRWSAPGGDLEGGDGAVSECLRVRGCECQR